MRKEIFSQEELLKLYMNKELEFADERKRVKLLGMSNLILEIFGEKVLYSLGFGLCESDEISIGINYALRDLTPREKHVIKERFSLDGNPVRTLKDIANDFSLVSAERIRQIEAKAIRKMKHSSRSLVLRKIFEGVRLTDMIFEMNCEILTLKTQVYSLSREKSLSDEKERKKAIEEYTIEDLNLSARACNVLRRAGIKNVIELIRLSEEDLMRLSMMGRKSIDDIEIKLKSYGLSLKEKD